MSGASPIPGLWASVITAAPPREGLDPGVRRAAERGGGRRAPAAGADTGTHRPGAGGAATAVVGPGRHAGRRARALGRRVSAGPRRARPGDGGQGGTAPRVHRSLGARRPLRTAPCRPGPQGAAADLGERRGADGRPLPAYRRGAALSLRPGRPAGGDTGHRVRRDLCDLARFPSAGARRVGARASDRRLRTAGVAPGAGGRRKSAARPRSRPAHHLAHRDRRGHRRFRRGGPDGGTPAARAVRARPARKHLLHEPGRRRDARRTGRRPDRLPVVGRGALAQRSDVRGPLPGCTDQRAGDLVRGAPSPGRLALLPSVPGQRRAERAYRPGPPARRDGPHRRHAGPGHRAPGDDLAPAEPRHRAHRDGGGAGRGQARRGPDSARRRLQGPGHPRLARRAAACARPPRLPGRVRHRALARCSTERTDPRDPCADHRSARLLRLLAAARASVPQTAGDPGRDGFMGVPPPDRLRPSGGHMCARVRRTPSLPGRRAGGAHKPVRTDRAGPGAGPAVRRQTAAGAGVAGGAAAALPAVAARHRGGRPVSARHPGHGDRGRLLRPGAHRCTGGRGARGRTGAQRDGGGTDGADPYGRPRLHDRRTATGPR